MSSALLTNIGHTSLLFLVTILGVAFIRLGGVNLVFLPVSPKFITTTFPMLPNPMLYSESESLLISQCFFFLVSCFLMAFSSLSIFLLNCTKECFVRLGFFPPFLVAQKLDFSILSFSYSIVCGVFAPMLLTKVVMLLSAKFLGNLACKLGTVPLVSFLALAGSLLIGL
jgi:hypothetical protein